MSKKLIMALVLCLSLGVAGPVFAQADQKNDPDVIAQLEREGWKIVSDGVLQRTKKEGEVETFVFGARGFTWKLRDLRRQLQKLQTELRYNPTPDLRKAIANHRKEIANTRKMIERARISDADKVDLSKVSCSIDFSYNASASGRTDVQGTKANSNAAFTANCAGFTGEVYAYAFAKTWLNGAETTETVTDGPRTGANVSATASATRAGGSPCESYAYASMTSNNLNPASYSMASNNYVCPFTPPPTVTVSMSPASSSSSPLQLYGYDCVMITWTTNISNGTAPYTTTMYRNNVSLGQRTSYSQFVCNAQSTYLETITVRSDVVDSAGKTASASSSAYVQHHYYQDTTTCGGFREPGQFCLEP